MRRGGLCSEYRLALLGEDRGMALLGDMFLSRNSLENLEIWQVSYQNDGFKRDKRNGLRLVRYGNIL